MSKLAQTLNCNCGPLTKEKKQKIIKDGCPAFILDWKNQHHTNMTLPLSPFNDLLKRKSKSYLLVSYGKTPQPEFKLPHNLKCPNISIVFLGSTVKNY